MRAFKISTEGDSEGRTTKEVGIFKGTIEQIMYYCHILDIKPCYNFRYNIVKIEDCSNIVVPDEFKVTIGNHGKIHLGVSEETKINNALAKLTIEEKTLLGLLK